MPLRKERRPVPETKTENEMLGRTKQLNKVLGHSIDIQNDQKETNGSVMH